MLTANRGVLFAVYLNRHLVFTPHRFDYHYEDCLRITNDTANTTLRVAPFPCNGYHMFVCCTDRYFSLVLAAVVDCSHVCVVLKVESEESYERIGGSSIGGGTFWGLGALLTHTKVSLLYVHPFSLHALPYTG